MSRSFHVDTPSRSHGFHDLPALHLVDHGPCPHERTINSAHVGTADEMRSNETRNGVSHDTSELSY